MSGDPSTDPLETVLEDVYAALRQGDLPSLAALSLRMEEALSRIAHPPEAAALRRLQDLARRNAACLEASARGIRAARRRLTEIRDARTGTRTYDGKGQASVIGPDESLLAHRA
ncbi:MAG: hypothetical protein ACK4GW_04165 [Pseudorhodobacter sp.]